MKVLITGAGGMVGGALAGHCRNLGDDVQAFDREGLDITDERAAREAFGRLKPEAVINCAAWTDVDGCELDPQRAFLVNSQGVEALATAARLAGASFVTVSTDYVFDGLKADWFYTQRDDPHPASAYGAAKLEGERRAQMASARTSVVRTGWVFGPGGRNFLATAVERARRGARLKAISDSWGTPTYAPDLAARLRELAELDLPGVYHVVNSGEGTSYEGFARAAAEAAGVGGVEIEPVLMDSLKRPAPRPRNSRLRCLLSEAVGLRPLRDWREALAEFAGMSK
ncbi:MAG: dTDP-4-dehydrorhamnose reductase [Acidobacteria bacterium]|nr:dTDP-4-dehydrorhamnose reductase [Acidobacteriota bacterium]MCA1620362.1 dTDP-4-dehydrorhamnose reductase [Acidobacteriota bacterium]